MNILILDDMAKEADELSMLLRELGFEPAIFHNGHEALDHINNGAGVDVCFLDIVMPEMSGVETAIRLRDSGYTSEIVFLSTSREYGPESYRVKAFDYLIKPPTPESVKNVLGRLVNTYNSDEKLGISVRTRAAVRFIRYCDLSYVEAMRNCVCFHLADGTSFEVYASFGEYADLLLLDKRFIQCHRSYIVNMDNIGEIADMEVITRGGAKIPVSRSNSDTKNTYFSWKFGRDSG
jgi:DNA-binding LytR/AlgR family response regulator